MLLLTNRSRTGPAVWPGSTAFQRDQGDTAGSSATLRGPVRRSKSAPIELRQLPAASSRSAGRNSTCISFSASANVDGETTGPTGAAVPKAGGAPAGVSAAFGFVLLVLHPAAAPSRLTDVLVRKRLRDFDILSSGELNAR